MDWIWTNCRFAMEALAGVQKELSDMGYMPSFIDMIMRLSRNNGNIAKNWTLPMAEEIGIDRLEKFMDYFSRKKEYNGKRDIFQITADDILGFEANEQAKQEQEQAYEIVYEKGRVKVYMAHTPQAASYLSNCEQLGENHWCTKTLGWAERYMRDKETGEHHGFFIIMFGGQIAYAVIPGPQGTITDANDHNVYKGDLERALNTVAGFQDVLDAIYFIVEKYSNGVWPNLGSGEGFREAGKMFISQKLDSKQIDESLGKAIQSMDRVFLVDVYPKIKEVYPTLSREQKAAVKEWIQRNDINDLKTSMGYALTNGRMPMSFEDLLKRWKGRSTLFGPLKTLLQTALNEMVQSGQYVQEPDGSYVAAAYASRTI